MPNVDVVLQETQQSIDRPAVNAIVRQLIAATGIDKNVKIMHLENNGQPIQPGSEFNAGNKDITITPADSLIQIKVEQRFNTEVVLATPVKADDNIPFFLDDKLGIIIKPAYALSDLVISFTNTSRSETDLRRWSDMMRLGMSTMRDLNIHQISYHYIVPDPILELLKHIHTLRENVAPYSETFEQYFNKHCVTNSTIISNLNGTNTELAITETQINLVGLYDFIGALDENTKETDKNKIENTFRYKISFYKPISCVMRYPVMVHNQKLDNKYLYGAKPHNLQDRKKSHDIYTGAGLRFVSYIQDGQIAVKSNTITLPDFDEFTPNVTLFGTHTVLTQLCSLTGPENTRDLFNLKDIEIQGYVIDSDILEFIKNSEWKYMTSPYQSILQLSLYRSNILAEEKILSIDENLNIFSNYDLNIRQNHRVRLSIVSDLNLLSSQAFTRLRQNPKAFVKILAALNLIGLTSPLANEWYYRRVITRDDFNRVVPPPDQQPYHRALKTVENGQVIFYKKE